jgi:hypothetical protein
MRGKNNLDPLSGQTLGASDPGRPSRQEMLHAARQLDRHSTVAEWLRREAGKEPIVVEAEKEVGGE